MATCKTNPAVSRFEYNRLKRAGEKQKKLAEKRGIPYRSTKTRSVTTYVVTLYNELPWVPYEDPCMYKVYCTNSAIQTYNQSIISALEDAESMQPYVEYAIADALGCTGGIIA